MTTPSEPRDYRLGRRAYEAFYNEQPQIWFEDLSHGHQMRWVNVARAVKEEQKKLPAVGRKVGYNSTEPPKIKDVKKKTKGRTPMFSSEQEAQAIINGLPRNKFGHIAWREVSEEARLIGRQAKAYLWRLTHKP